MTTFISTVIIVIILVGFLLVSGVVKTFAGEVKIEGVKEVGLSGIEDYMNNFVKFADVRALVASGKPVAEALEVGDG